MGHSLSSHQIHLLLTPLIAIHNLMLYDMPCTYLRSPYLFNWLLAYSTVSKSAPSRAGRLPGWMSSDDVANGDNRFRLGTTRAPAHPHRNPSSWAKISPNPSIIPLINGSARLMAHDAITDTRSVLLRACTVPLDVSDSISSDSSSSSTAGSAETSGTSSMGKSLIFILLMAVFDRARDL